jgi:hypothetical protein
VTPTETTTARTGSFLTVPMLFTYCYELGLFNSYGEDSSADIEVEM